MSDDLIKRLESVEIAAVRANRELLGTKPVTQVNADVKEAAARLRGLEAQVGRVTVSEAARERVARAIFNSLVDGHAGWDQCADSHEDYLSAAHAALCAIQEPNDE